MNRRDFITRTVAGVAGATVIAPHLLQGKNLTHMSGPIGFQSWIKRDAIGKDFPGTLKMMAGLGYNSIEMCSPPGYSGSGFAALANLKASEMKSIITGAGFTCVSCHYGFDELKQHNQERIDFAKELGLQQMIISSFGLPKGATLADWKKAADDANKLGEQAKKSGIQMGFHNHNGEFEKLEGQLIYDTLLKQFDPELIKMQFQVAVVTMGYNAADYFRRYPGRFISAHLYDWSGTGQELVPVGKGKVDWKDFFAAAKTGGVKNFYVEMENGLKESADFLKSV